MAIEFHCPNGHILEVDDEHAGKQIRCPACDARCLVPPRSAVATPPPAPVEESIPLVSPRKMRKTRRRRGVAGRRQPLDVSVPEAADMPAAAGEPVLEQPSAGGVKLRAGIKAADRETLHFNCSHCGQLLAAPSAMLGQNLACAACGHAFMAELKQSIEYIREKSIKDEREERLLNNRWLSIAIFCGILVAACLIGMVVWSSGR